ncbi:unnamed protein product, partial [Discosporangium mesarthrocarpum]
QDVDEFLLVFLDRLERQLTHLPQKCLLQHVFGGRLCNQLIGQETGQEGCLHVSEKEEDFFVLSLEVKGKRCITESLQLYVEGEVLDGDNKFHCDPCNKKRATLKRACISHLPNVLILHLKRFEFDFEQMRKVKVNDLCEFPMELDMRPFTKEGLERQHQQGEPGEAQGQGDLNQKRPTSKGDAYYNYLLAGVLVHAGTADSGHYYSYIKERQSLGGGGGSGDGARWLSFNDTTVVPFDPRHLAANCYGGHSVGMGGRGVQPKHFSAYMLIYEREEVLPNPKPETQGQGTRDISRSTSPTPANGRDVAGSAGGKEGGGSVRGDEDDWSPPWSGVPHPSGLVPQSIFQACWQENRYFLMDKNLFSTEYLGWLAKLISLVPPP